MFIVFGACYDVWNRIYAENAPKYWEKSSKTWKYGRFQIEPKTQYMFSYHGSPSQDENTR